MTNANKFKFKIQIQNSNSKFKLNSIQTHIDSHLTDRWWQVVQRECGGAHGCTCDLMALNSNAMTDMAGQILPHLHLGHHLGEQESISLRKISQCTVILCSFHMFPPPPPPNSVSWSCFFFLEQCPTGMYNGCIRCIPEKVLVAVLVVLVSKVIQTGIEGRFSYSSCSIQPGLGSSSLHNWRFVGLCTSVLISPLILSSHTCIKTVLGT